MILVKWCLLLQAVAFSPTYAHLRMASPEPYGSSRKTLDNSPLAADGSDFPCKISPGDFIVPTEEATYRTGSNNIIKLLGSATHGGGSCQVASPVIVSRQRIRNGKSSSPTKGDALQKDPEILMGVPSRTILSNSLRDP
ncbi:unnamed protein product [Penicillium nalgiovense]|nr:unnamed protein product [Penicillium nalgiovense]